MRLIGELTPKLSLYGTISKTADVIGSNIQPITIRKNGTYEVSDDVDGFNPIYVNTPEPKEEQEKIVDIIENGTVEILPDGNRALSKVTIKSNVPDTSDIIEDIIDNSGVLENTEGTVSVMEKVEKLIGKAEDENIWYDLTGQFTSSFPTIFSKKTCEVLPRMNLSNAILLSNAFSGMPNLRRIDDYWNTASCTNFSNCFAYSNALEYVKGINTSKSTTVGGMFRDCNSLKTIEEPLDFSSAINTGAFVYTPALESVRFIEGTIKQSIAFNSPLLSAESIKSIIDGLATVTTAQTLTLHKNTKILQSQVDSANAKGWTVAGGTVVSEEEYYG
jgi:hypothetical protein